MDCYCYHHTSHHHPRDTAKGNPYPYLCSAPSLILATTATPSPPTTATLLLSACPRPSPPKQLLAAFHLSLPRCHQPINPSILLDSPLSPTPWVVAPRAAGAWGTRWAPTAARHARIVPSVWLSANAPSYRISHAVRHCYVDPSCASVASSYHVHPASPVSRKRSRRSLTL